MLFTLVLLKTFSFFTQPVRPRRRRPSCNSRPSLLPPQQNDSRQQESLPYLCSPVAYFGNPNAQNVPSYVPRYSFPFASDSPAK
jgi:hypothetical protein